MAEQLRTVATVASWFALNIMIGNLNGWVLRRYGFAYPVLLTTIHMVCCCVLSALYNCTVRAASEHASVSAELRRKVNVLSLAFCASVACGNIALRYIYVSFAQMVSAATPLFTIILMRTMAGRKYSTGAYLSMIPMCGGVMMCVGGEINFHALGFAAVVASALLRGVKSILQGWLLTEPDEKLDSITLLYYMSRSSIVLLGAFSAATEYDAWQDPLLWERRKTLRLWGLVWLSGFIAFFLNVANFLVTKYTSPVALQASAEPTRSRPPVIRPWPATSTSAPRAQVFGNVKVVLSITISLVIFGNRVSVWSVVGCAITLGGVALYNRAPKG